MLFDDESILTQKLKPMINYKNKFSVLIPSEDVEEIKEEVIEEVATD